MATSCAPIAGDRNRLPPTQQEKVYLVYDTTAEQPRTWLRTDGIPSVTLTDPLQAHVDMLRTWTDTDIHNVTAYLASLR